MTQPYQQYIEDSVQTATPLELVTLLYRCALEGIADARYCLRTGDIAGRVKPVNRAYDAVMELSLSLDHETGGEFSRNLSELYGYISSQIILGHSQQSDDRFAEASRLMSTLLEAWEQMATAPAAANTEVGICVAAGA